MELIKAAVTAVDTSKAAKLANIRPETEIRELGLDSVATMEMVGFLEEKLETQFSDEVMVRINTFGDLVALIEKSRNGI
ncbi:MAG: acyl carrier protein [Myxococcota bacterium]